MRQADHIGVLNARTSVCGAYVLKNELDIHLKLLFVFNVNNATTLLVYVNESRDKYPAKTAHVPPATDAFVEIVHSKSHSTVITKAQATAWPYDNTPWGTLAHDAEWPSITHSGCPFCP